MKAICRLTSVFLFTALISGLFSGCDGNSLLQYNCDHKNTIITKDGFYHCSQEGLTEEISCADCNKILQKQEPIKPLGHSNTGGLCWMCNHYFNLWEMEYDIDKFGDRTDEYFIKNTDPFYIEYNDYQKGKKVSAPAYLLVNATNIIISLPENVERVNAYYVSLILRSSAYNEDIVFGDVGKFDGETGKILISDAYAVDAFRSLLMSGEEVKAYVTMITYMSGSAEFLLTFPTEGFAEKYNEYFSD